MKSEAKCSFITENLTDTSSKLVLSEKEIHASNSFHILGPEIFIPRSVNGYSSHLQI